MDVSSELISFLVGILSFGGMLGFLSGFATKKMVKIITIVLGIIFVILQMLAFSRIISVNWGYIQGLTSSYFNQNYLEKGMNYFMQVLMINIPFAGSFAAGFWMGVRKG